MDNVSDEKLVSKIGAAIKEPGTDAATVMRKIRGILGQPGVGGDLEDLRAEVTRTAAVVQALAASDVSGTRRPLDDETERLIELRYRQSETDPVLVGRKASILSELNRLDDFLEERFPDRYETKTPTVDLAIKLLGELAK